MIFPFLSTLLQWLLLGWGLYGPFAVTTLDSGRYLHVFHEPETVHIWVEARRPPIVILHDATGREIARIPAQRAHGRTVADFGSLGAGYYEARAGRRQLAFVVLADPAKRVPGPSRLAIDLGVAHNLDPAHYADAAYLLSKLGFDWVRERLTWSVVEPQRGSYRWDTRYEEAINALSAQGINVYEVFHATPAWARADSDRKKMPDDLRDIYRFSRTLAQHYRGRVQAWEVWNEPDIAFFNDSSAEVAAFQKAAYLGFHSADPELHILGPSMAFAAGPFAEHLLINGLGPYFDVWNYHVYAKVHEYKERAQGFRDLLARHELDKPMWVTEAGLPAGRMGQISRTAHLAQAAFLSQSMPESLAVGNDRHFWFLFSHLPFGLSDWGLFASDRRTPLPALAALSTVTYALGRAEYRGRLKGLDPEVRAHVFDRGDGSQAVVLWRNGKNPGPVQLPLDWSQVQEALNAFGQRLPRGRNAVTLPLNHSTFFLILTPGIPEDRLTNRPAPAATDPASRPAPSPLVARLRLDGAELHRKSDTYHVQPGRGYAVQAEVYNFGKQPREVRLEFSGPAAGLLDGYPSSQLIAPMERMQLTLQLRVDGTFAAGGLQLRALAGSQASTPSAIWLAAPSAAE